MLLGEYAALSGGRAIAATVNRQLQLDWKDSPELALSLISPIWSREFKAFSLQELEHLRAAYPLEVALDHLVFLARRFEVWKGGSIQISSTIKPTDGLGSSSALRLALTGAFLKQPLAQTADLAFEAQNAFQNGKASGYDVATQATGGLCLYQKKAASLLQNVERLQMKLPVRLTIFAGNKGDATASSVNAKRPQLEKDSEFLALNERCIDQFLDPAFEESVFIGLVAKILNEHLAKLPQFPQAVFWELRHIAGFGESWVVKTTGAGGFDSLISFGAIPAEAHRVIERYGWVDRTVELAL